MEFSFAEKVAILSNISKVVFDQEKTWAGTAYVTRARVTLEDCALINLETEKARNALVGGSIEDNPNLEPVPGQKRVSRYRLKPELAEKVKDACVALSLTGETHEQILSRIFAKATDPAYVIQKDRDPQGDVADNVRFSVSQAGKVAQVARL